MTFFSEALDEQQTIFISRHGFERMKERKHMNTARARTTVLHAWNQGDTMETAPEAWQRDYIRKIAFKYEDGGVEVRLYQGFIYIFSAEGILITVYRCAKHRSGILYDGKKKVRKLRKYLRMNTVWYVCAEM